MPPPPPPTIRAFVLWLKRQGARLEGVRLHSSEHGTSVVSTRAIHEREVVAAVPERLVMSMITLRSSATDALVEHGFRPAAVLQLAVAAERALGPASTWYPYLATLPESEDLPLVWSAAEQRWLAGTGLDVAARARRRALLATYKEMAAFLAAELDAQQHESDDALRRLAAVSPDAYVAVATLVSSRALHVDERHGYSYVAHGLGCAPRPAAAI
jgi:hypothetical protein